MIILSLGGEKAAVKAYSIHTGDEVWQSQASGEAVYLSPEILSLLGEDHLIVSMVGKIISLDPKTVNLYGRNRGKFLNNVQIVQPIQAS